MVLLFDQAVRLRSVGILVLACGYLFDALIIVPHALSFPGAFSSTGLLGAKEQTTAWLYVFWHGGFPLFVIAYVLLRHRKISGTPSTRMEWMIAWSAIGVVLLTAALTLIATWGHDALPVVMQGSDYSLLVAKGISPAVWLLTLVAMFSLWHRQQRVVNLWLMLVMWIWLFDIALAAIIGSTRFDLGFYAGRIFGLIGASFLLIALLVEMAAMHAGALRAATTAQQRLAEQLARLRSRPEPKPPHVGSIESFLSRENIQHYRLLLESGSLDEAQRRSVEQLLHEEERKQKANKEVPE